MVAMPAFAYDPVANDPVEWTAVRDAKGEQALSVAPELAEKSAQEGAADLPNTVMHSGVFKALAGLNAFILVAFWVTLRSDREALFMVAISAFYLLAYMGTPYIMSRVAGKRLDGSKSLSQFLAEPFDTWTGTVTGREAMIQVLTVPAAIALAVAGMCLIIASHQ